MDFRHVDDLARTLARAPSRRNVLRSLAGAGLGLAITRPSLPVEARKRRKRKSRNPRTPQATPNEFGCLNVDLPCTSAEQCCSGICEGASGSRTCRAHDVGDCEAGFALESEIPCTTSRGDDGLCSTTTGNAGYCMVSGACYPCKTDQECQRADNGFFGPTAACITFAACEETGGTVCALARL